jgi:hypothetical protein
MRDMRSLRPASAIVMTVALAAAAGAFATSDGRSTNPANRLNGLTLPDAKVAVNYPFNWYVTTRRLDYVVDPRTLLAVASYVIPLRAGANCDGTQGRGRPAEWRVHTPKGGLGSRIAQAKPSPSSASPNPFQGPLRRPGRMSATVQRRVSVSGCVARLLRLCQRRSTSYQGNSCGCRTCPRHDEDRRDAVTLATARTSASSAVIPGHWPRRPKFRVGRVG